MNGLKIGDKVNIINDGKIYTSYPEWARAHKMGMYRIGASPQYNIDNFKIVAIGSHEDTGIELVGISNDKQSFIIASSGVEKVKTPHKHHVEIKAWADGAKIQLRIGGEVNWRDVDNPRWLDEYEFRIAPEIKEDIIKYVGVNEKHMTLTGMFDKLETLTSYGWENPVQFTFDGETNKLKDVKIM